MKVTQGKTWENNEECCAAANAVDKDLSRGAATHTDDGAGWLKLEFDRTYFIHKIIIYYWFFTNWYNPSAWCVQSEDRFQRCVDDDNNVRRVSVPGRGKTEVLWNTPTNIRTRTVRSDLHTVL